MKQNKYRIGILLTLIVLLSLACSLTSPTPASWSRTPTAQARAETSTAVAMTQGAVRTQAEALVPPTLEATEAQITTPTSETSLAAVGPWLVYPGRDGETLVAYDLASGQNFEINLPAPIYVADLARGLSPDGETLIVRAGSPDNLDELALYQIQLPGGEITKISPLLSLMLQRNIVNNTDSKAFEALQAVTQEDGLAWSPNSRYLAFNAALDNQSSDLYIYDTFENQIDRLNGLSTQNGGLFWTPGSNTLISQEFGEFNPDENNWYTLYVTGIQVPGFENQNTLYFPSSDSLGEFFLGWLNSQTFVSYSSTPSGLASLRQSNYEKLETIISFEGQFDDVCFDPQTKAIVMVLGDESAAINEMLAGIYLLEPESSVFNLQRAGDWDTCVWNQGGSFVVEGSQGVFVFGGDGEDTFLPDEGHARLSPSGNWMVGWGDGVDGDTGARLYQTSNNKPLQVLSEEPIKTAFWQPDSLGFFLLGESSLNHLEFPGLNPEAIEEGLWIDDPLTFIWVE